MKKRHLAFALLSLCAVLAAAPRIADPDFFLISPWGAANWVHTENRQEVFDDMADCGMTVAGFVDTVEELDMAEKAGLLAWGNPKIPYGPYCENGDEIEANAETILEGVKKTVEYYNDHPALYGYNLRDEPSTRAFPYLKFTSDEFKRLDPSRRTYINLLPNYALPEQFGAANYYEYAEQFLNTIKPDRFGYDYYAMLEKTPDSYRPGIWKQLAETREISLKHGVPFEVVVLSVGHLIYRIPTENDLFLQVYSAILYGAKGIYYFTYLTPGLSSYRHAPIDPWGNKTETWYAMRRVNNSIRCLAPVINRLNSTAVYHFQPGEPKDGELTPPENRMVIAPENPDQEIIVGEFRDAETDEEYVMLLNKNLKFTTYVGRIKWRDDIDPAKLVVYSSFVKGGTGHFSGENCWLAPGQALIMKVERRE